MSAKVIITAGMLGASVAAITLPASAQTLKILDAATASILQVPMNRAVVVEADQPFATLSVANPAIADISTLSDHSLYVLGKAPGRTTLTLLGPEGKLITNVDVQVSLDVAEFKERLQQILPNEKIEVRTANDGIVLSGTVSSMAALDRALDLAERYAPQHVSNLMGVGGTQQVMLQVRFAEMDRAVTKSLSTSLGIGGTLGGGDVATVIGTQTYSSGNNLVNLFDGDPETVTTRTNPATGVFGFGFGAGALEFNILLEALEGKGLVRTLAEPNLTALSGQEAKFLAGGEYPIPVSSQDGISIEYKPFGVELAFTPRVVDGTTINLMIDSAVSGIDSSIVIGNNGFNVNGFKRRQTQTTVEMHDGESFAISGLLTDDFYDSNAQVPWLGDVPILGSLFRSAKYERRQSELVVIVTPHLVSPTRGEALALPTDRIKPPSEAALFLNGKVAGSPGATGEVARQDFSGSYGYVME